jgi:hypothetical protein
MTENGKDLNCNWLGTFRTVCCITDGVRTMTQNNQERDKAE